jgi:tRNA-binding protein
LAESFLHLFYLYSNLTFKEDICQKYKNFIFMQTIDISDFQKIEIRIGTVIKVEPFAKSRNPSYKVYVDLGEIGVKKSSAQITHYYTPEELLGKQVICVCNFKPRQIADFMSEVLITGFSDGKGVVLAGVDFPVPNGAILH